MRTRFPTPLIALGVAALLASCSDGTTGASITPADPGTAEWEPVPPERVASECGLDPDLLAAADRTLERPWAAIRYGKLCHEYYPDGDPAEVTEVFSTTKTLGALVTGIAAWETRDLPRTGRRTGPISDEDRVDHWLDAFTFNPEARIAHVLAMVAHNEDLSLGEKIYSYDTVGTVQINRLSDVVNTAIAQDPERLGADLEEFTQRYLYAPLGMRDSMWSRGKPDKVYAYSWETTVRDMARVGLLMLRGGSWNGERILSEEWVYRMTHPAFEDANTSYGYLTWMYSRSNWGFSGTNKIQGPFDSCSPAALWDVHPHGLSDSPDCNYDPPYACGQALDVGAWYAAGADGQYIVGHRGLDLVLVVKSLGPAANASQVWKAMRPALVALDPTYAGDEAAFCAAYGANEYAPDLP